MDIIFIWFKLFNLNRDGWGNSAGAKKLCQAFLNIFMIMISFYQDCLTFLVVFADHVEDPKCASSMGSFQHKVNTPDMVRIFWSRPYTGAMTVEIC
jgi:hypothetical protein